MNAIRLSGKSKVKRKLTIKCKVEIVHDLSNDAIARVYYPDEGNKISIKKGLNVLEFSEAIFHEIGHLVDWYIGKQSNLREVREKNADIIGDSLRLRLDLKED